MIERLGLSILMFLVGTVGLVRTENLLGFASLALAIAGDLLAINYAYQLYKLRNTP